MDQPDLEANTCNTLHTWGKHVSDFGVRNNKLISNAGKKLVLMKESLRTASSMERDETALVLKNIQFALVQENMKTASSFINVFSGRGNLFCA